MFRDRGRKQPDQPEFSPKDDLDRGVTRFLEQKGIPFAGLKKTRAHLLVSMKFDELSVQEVPENLRSWFDERYSPRKVEMDEVEIEYGDRYSYQEGKAIWTPYRRIRVEVATYVASTEEQIIAERSPVVIPDEEVFGLPVIHTVRQAESVRRYRGVVIPEEGRVIYNHTLIEPDNKPPAWKQVTASLDDWANRRSNFGTLQGEFPPELLSTLGKIIPQLEGEEAYRLDKTFAMRRAIPQPRRMITIL